jgi:hypothetical protein
VAIVLIVVSLLAVLPVPDDWREAINDSNVVQAIAGEDAIPRQLFESLAGDNVMAAMASIRGLFGSSRAVPVGDEILDIPPAPADEVRQARTEAELILERVNEHRVGVGLGAVTSIGAVTTLAEDHAVGQYTTGHLQRLQDCAANLALRSYQVIWCDNGVALAGTAAGGFEGILETPEGRTMIETPDAHRAGVAVVDGPTGRLVVLILAG